MILGCPICGKDDRVEVLTSKNTYETLYKEEGSACISIRCWRCALELYDHTPFGIDQYEQKKNVLIARWNNMPRKENEDDGK